MVILNLANLPFKLSGQTFNELPEKETSFFIDNEYFPLPDNHAVQIILLNQKSFDSIKYFVVSRLWDNYIHDFLHFSHIEKISLCDKWNSELGI